MFSDRSTRRFQRRVYFFDNRTMKKTGDSHPTFERLMAFAIERTRGTRDEIKSISDLALALSASIATVSNWSRRGVSQPGAITAELKFGCSASYILHGELMDIEATPKTLGERLIFMRKLRKLTLEELSDSSGIAVSAISKIETGGIGKMPDIHRLARALGCDAHWLETGEGAWDSDQNTDDGPDLGKRLYPVISEVQAGEWCEISDRFAPGEAEEWRGCHKDLGPHGFVLRVTGDSMTVTTPGAPHTFPEGMLLYVKAGKDHHPGQYVIVRREGDKKATFKKLTLVDGELFLEAINPNWPNRYLKLQDGDTICGVVVHAGFDMP